MASSSRQCSDEQLQKARADLKELITRNPIPDQFKFPGGDDDDEEENTKKAEEKKKKKKLYRLPPEEVQLLLSYECEPLPPRDAIDRLAEKDAKYADLQTGVSILQTFGMHYNDSIRAAQEKMRFELLTKGYVTYEATDDEADDEAAPPPPPPAGRRRHRPGVTKDATGGIKKLN
ncbi:hypothetical protein ACP4OV_002062 [Aristida adscensionis]